MKHFSLFIHSTLIVGALLPLSPIATSLKSVPSAADLPFTIDNEPAVSLVAYGGGIPRFRGGGGTR